MNEENDKKPLYAPMHLDHSNSVGEIAGALVGVQKELKSIRKDSSGYGYNYTSISEVMDYLLPLLSKNGIAVTQFGGGTTSDGRDVVITMLVHKGSGEYLKGHITLPHASELDMKSINVAQKAGALRTYYKRYAVCEMVGLTSNDEDTDCSDSAGNKSSKGNAARKSSEKKSEPKKENKPSSGSSFRRKKKEDKGDEDDI